MLSGFKKQNLISMSRAIMTSNPQHFQLPKFQVPTLCEQFSALSRHKTSIFKVHLNFWVI